MHFLEKNMYKYSVIFVLDWEQYLCLMETVDYAYVMITHSIFVLKAIFYGRPKEKCQKKWPHCNELRDWKPIG